MKMAKMVVMVHQGAWTGTRSYKQLQSTQPWSQNHHNTPIVVVERLAVNWEQGIICVRLWFLSSLSALTATSKGRVMVKQLLKPEVLTAGHSSSLMRAHMKKTIRKIIYNWRLAGQITLVITLLISFLHWSGPSLSRTTCLDCEIVDCLVVKCFIFS